MAAPPRITLYTTAVCPYCVAAKNFLRSRSLDWVEVSVDTDPVQRKTMIERSGRTSVPQIFIGDTHVGGFEDLVALDRSGGLEPMLRGAA